MAWFSSQEGAGNNTNKDVIKEVVKGSMHRMFDHVKIP